LLDAVQIWNRKVLGRNLPSKELNYVETMETKRPGDACTNMAAHW
jgi:hypothetical protein